MAETALATTLYRFGLSGASSGTEQKHSPVSSRLRLAARLNIEAHGMLYHAVFHFLFAQPTCGHAAHYPPL
jgi:hypothetical protein